MNCDYCGESDEFIMLIPKPRYFIWKGTILNNVQAFRREDIICLECLDYELNEIKHN